MGSYLVQVPTSGHLFSFPDIHASSADRRAEKTSNGRRRTGVTAIGRECHLIYALAVFGSLTPPILSSWALLVHCHPGTVHLQPSEASPLARRGDNRGHCLGQTGMRQKAHHQSQAVVCWPALRHPSCLSTAARDPRRIIHVSTVLNKKKKNARQTAPAVAALWRRAPFFCSVSSNDRTGISLRAIPHLIG